MDFVSVQLVIKLGDIYVGKDFLEMRGGFLFRKFLYFFFVVSLFYRIFIFDVDKRYF